MGTLSNSVRTYTEKYQARYIRKYSLRLTLVFKIAFSFNYYYFLIFLWILQGSFSSIKKCTHISRINLEPMNHTYSPRKTISILICPDLWRRKFLRKAVTLSTVMFPQTTMNLGSKTRWGGSSEEQKYLPVKI